MSDVPPLKTPLMAQELLGQSAPPPAEVQPSAPHLSVSQGGWTAASLLLLQNVVSAVALQGFKLPLGTSLLLSFISTVLVFRLIMPGTFRLLLSDTRWTTRPNIGVALGAFALSFAASRSILIFVLSLWPQGSQNIPQFQSSGFDLWVLLLVAGVLIPIAEEIAFRGTLMRGLEWARGPLVAAVMSSLIFAFAHGAPAQVAAILPLAWVLARVVQYSGSLWNSVIIHVLNNSLAVGLGALLQGKTFGALSGDVAGMKIPLGLGLAGLLMGVTALIVASFWLTPRTSPRSEGGSIWTVSTVLLVVLVLAVVALASLPLLFPGLLKGV
ncbi:type II CAAX endopeptidase family protein [Deinococcus sp.]|uniref:CPBP family intramembrane glutamic endopeptidase n=1 Tax=Deinococcus sp. TaxID=47478 RepID=UPI0025ED2CF4|nr:type II CAAX endopeptidase family protein [Deinococcus sp.]